MDIIFGAIAQEERNFDIARRVDTAALKAQALENEGAHSAEEEFDERSTERVKAGFREATLESVYLLRSSVFSVEWKEVCSDLLKNGARFPTSRRTRTDCLVFGTY